MYSPVDPVCDGEHTLVHPVRQSRSAGKTKAPVELLKPEPILRCNAIDSLVDPVRCRVHEPVQWLKHSRTTRAGLNTG